MPTNLTRARRLHHKAAYDRATIDAILDATPVAHVGHLVAGQSVVTPTLQWRDGDRVYWHGSSASRMMRAAAGAQVCLTVTRLDGLVLARSGLEHSVNYATVMLFGTAEPVTGPAAKSRALQVMMDQMFPGRWPQLRPMTMQEVKATAVLSLPIAEASAKLSTGFPTDPEADLDWPVWAGIVPIRQVVDAPEPDPRCLPGMTTPVVRFR